MLVCFCNFFHFESFEENLRTLFDFEELEFVEYNKLKCFYENFVKIITCDEITNFNGDDLYLDLCMLY